MLRNLLPFKYFTSIRSLRSSQTGHPPDLVNDTQRSPLASCLEADPFTVLISPHEHRERQEKLVKLVHQSLGSHENKSTLLIIPAARKLFQADTQIPTIHFKQNSDFIYLTGLNSIESANCILAILGDGNSLQSILFAPMGDTNKQMWEGSGILSPENNKRISIISNDVLDLTGIESFIDDKLHKRRVFVIRAGVKIQSKHFRENNNEREIKPGHVLDISSANKAENLSHFIDQLRVIKSSNEVKAMKRTCLIGSHSLESTMKWTRGQFDVNNCNFNIPLVNESQISAKFDYESRVNGACKVAYPSVCAGSHRSTIIHYGANDKFVSCEDWILMDAGCEDIEGYNSDITRSWSLSGESSQSKLHFALYQALVEVHEEMIQTLRNGKTSLDKLFGLMCNSLGRLLIEFCVIPKSSSASEASRVAFKYCPHHVSHYLGLDVHDTPSISRSIDLEPGMCFTVEPGLYFRKQDDVKKEFQGIGLRVEDDLLINGAGQVEVLTQKCRRIYQ